MSASPSHIVSGGALVDRIDYEAVMQDLQRQEQAIMAERRRTLAEATAAITGNGSHSGRRGIEEDIATEDDEEDDDDEETDDEYANDNHWHEEDVDDDVDAAPHHHQHQHHRRRHQQHPHDDGIIEDAEDLDDDEDDDDDETEGHPMHHHHPGMMAPDGGAGGVGPGGDDRMLDDEEDEEGIDEMDYEPTEQEILEYCEWLNMDPEADRQLTWIAREALKAPLPENWRQCYTEEREVYYFNMRTGESIWDHPMDAYYKALFKQEKAKLDKKRKHMRLFSGSMEIKPMAEFFSDASDTCGLAMEGDNIDTDPNSAWYNVPETLIDAIDFRIYIDPVVLPTSGRTVSRHTIINNKWRDPFSREYVENRRLVPNVDKKSEVESWINKMMTSYMESLSAADEKALERLLAFVPFMLDKEEEGCVRGQRILLNYFNKHLTPPPPPPPPKQVDFAEKEGDQPLSARSATSEPNSARNSRNSSATTRSKLSSSTKSTMKKTPLGSSTRASAGSGGARNTAKKLGSSARIGKDGKLTTGAAKSREVSKGAEDAKTEQPPPPPPPPSLIELITALPDEKVRILLGALLTMSSSSSREALLKLLKEVPKLASHTTFRGYADPVLNVLHLSPQDLARIAASVINAEVSARQKKELERLNSVTMSTSGSAEIIGASSPTTSSVPRLPVLSPTRNGNTVPAPPSGSGDNAATGTNNSTSNNGNTLEKDGTSTEESKEQLFSTYVVTNSEHVLALDWVHAVQHLPEPKVNALYQLEFVAALHLILAMKATTAIKATSNNLNNLLRGCNGWPTCLSGCSDDQIRCLMYIAIEDEAPLSQVTTLFDVCLNGGERGMDLLRTNADVVKTNLLHLSKTVQSSHPAGLVVSSPIDMLGAVLVFHEMMKLEDFVHVNPAVAIRVAYNLGPRLTRSQWRPKHFHQTVGKLITLSQEQPLLAWATIGSKGLLFFIKELSKKKTNSDDVRSKLESIEASERQLEQSNSINNWAIMSVKGMISARRSAVAEFQARKVAEQNKKKQKQEEENAENEKEGESNTFEPKSLENFPHAGASISAQLDKLLKRKEDIEKQRAQNIVSALTILLQIRLKPKQRGSDPSGKPLRKDGKRDSDAGSATTTAQHNTNNSNGTSTPGKPGSRQSAPPSADAPRDSGRRHRPTPTTPLGPSMMTNESPNPHGSSSTAAPRRQNSSRAANRPSVRGVADGALPPQPTALVANENARGGGGGGSDFSLPPI